MSPVQLWSSAQVLFAIKVSITNLIEDNMENFNSKLHRDNFAKESKEEETLKTEFGSVIKQEKEPIKDLVQKFEKLFYFLGAITKSSKFARGIEGEKERPFFLRNRRARLLKELKELPENQKMERGEIINEARILDKISEQYMNQREISINLPNYGKQKARTFDLNPDAKDKPPIFLVPGISNDIECVGNLGVEAALRGRRIVTVGYPESFMGETTQKFADAVEKDSSFGPHTEFFRAALDALFEKDQEIEIWGYSTGAPIISAILKEEKYQKRTKKAVLLFPAAVVNQSIASLNIGVAHSLALLFKNFKRTASATFGINKESKEKSKLRNQIMGALIIKDIKENNDWKEARVQEGGKIMVISGGNDKITKSALVEENFKKGNNQIETITLPEAHHLSGQTEPEKLIDVIQI